MLTRRLFLASATALGANDRVNVGIIGLGGRSVDHINSLARLPGARIAAVCDVNQAAQERAVALVEKATGSKPAVYGDMRRMFESKDVEAVTMATPNHWHALGAIWACQAGKDVYVEKPACHNPFEGRILVEAAAKYKRIVQVGSQGRSQPYRQRAVELIRSGIIGQVYLAKGLCYKRRKTIGKTPEIPVPPGIDWDQFLGPAQHRPFTWNRFKYNWHWMWETGNGDIGNQGVHEVDFARWAMRHAMPESTVSTGGKFVYDDDQETPNTQLSTFDYGKDQIVFEVRGLPTQPEENVMIGNIFYGSEGFIAVDQAGFRVYKGEDKEKVTEEKIDPKAAVDPTPHFDNFLRAVRSRDAKSLTAPVEEGVKSANLCHLANASYRLGRRVRFDLATGQCAGDGDATALMTRRYRTPYIVPERP